MRPFDLAVTPGIENPKRTDRNADAALEVGEASYLQGRREREKKRKTTSLPFFPRENLPFLPTETAPSSRFTYNQ
jgi:hypothetical protein